MNFDIKFKKLLIEAHVGILSNNPQRDANVGMWAEQEFEKVCEQNRLVCKKSTREQDMREHFDYVVFKRNKERAWIERPENATNKKTCNYVEVKNEKRLNDKILVELTNVRGDIGWLYGKANYIAYQKPSGGFKMVHRYSLLKEVEKIANFDKLDKDKFVYKDNRQPVIFTQDKYESNIGTNGERAIFYKRNLDIVLFVPEEIIQNNTSFELNFK